MTSEFTSPLSSFVSLVRGTTYKGALVGQPGPVLLGLASIQPDGGFRQGAFKTYGGESPAKITLGPGDIYVSLKDVTQSGDLLGSVARVPPEIPAGRLTQDTVKLEFNGRAIDRDYVYWLLRTPAYRAYCRARATGTTTLGLARDDFLGFPILEPSENELSLVQLLEALDDRISVLRETNATLEAIAQALFKSWFVDFDPVRAKQQGVAPAGMAEATAALFPDGFEGSRRGLTPRGWSEASIYEVAKVIYGAPFASSKFNSEAVGRPLIRIRDLRDEAPGVHTPEVHPKGYVVKAGDVVVGMDGEFRAYLWGGEEAWLNQRVCVFAPKAGVPAAFVRSVVEPQLAHIEATETATTVIHLGKGDIDRFTALLPPAAVLRAFAEVADPIYGRIVANKQTVRTLATLRDTLLPRLISGQLRLPEAEAEALSALA